MPNIEIRSLGACYQGRPILKSVSLEIRAGELFFLIGPSGCGKTTLLRLIAGFLEADHGDILFDGQSLLSLPPHRRETAMVFQSYALWPHRTVAANIAFGLEARGIPSKQISARVEEALQQVQLEGFGPRQIGELSGGQQQRVALARALIVRPRCLLLDEPLSNLDARLRKGVREEIRRICKDHGLTTIYVTHDREEALSLADRLAVMVQGQVLQVGPPDEVYRRPVQRTVAEFLGETNLLPGFLEAPPKSAVPRILRCAEKTVLLENGQDTRAFPAAQPVLLSIRPEFLSFGVAPESLACVTFEGIVRARSFEGATVRYRLELQGGETLEILTLNDAKSLRQSGDRAAVFVPLDDVVLLEPDSL